ncbi:MAG TPA: helix-turn-helix domain-containing protein [Candidatus Faecalibacterium faecipullorum]|uniref:Helix-turn-helix domain-containing protein n=1 Tax=Candidatus Faecalibacterium faecipullorum TaxID=2838578 RepID=A0A9D2MEI8_9FIRM|nr:helix-turn-helix domain-containing protein [Candidatus Faecalibacterium faecipullorum]
MRFTLFQGVGLALALIIWLVVVGTMILITVLVIKALWTYIKVNTKAREVKKETAAVRKTLAETLKDHRTRCKMTQEFVAESIGVSRQAVSKWETGDSDPTMSNLVLLAKLYGVPLEELLENVI